MGSGFLKLEHFVELLSDNPQLKEIELANYGEIMLNPNLLDILIQARERGVVLRADGGVNLNTASDGVLEGIVKYGLRSMSCSIDGASDQVYRMYRVNGVLARVLDNIRKINAFKKQYGSRFPILSWQFVVFGHNEHEIEQARELAGSLSMRFRLKLSWDPDHSPVTHKAKLRELVGAASREEYRQRFGVDYGRPCHHLWCEPQINWDGRVLGCPRNFWGEFGGNAFIDGLVGAVNSDGIRYARQMLLGRKPARESIPCTTCSVYQGMLADGKWLGIWPTTSRYRAARFVRRAFTRLERGH